MRTNFIVSRRELLARTGCGFGLLALADLLVAETGAETGQGSDRAARPFAVRAPHHVARAKRIIFLYMPGGPSHVDLFDPKPQLVKDNGKPLAFEKPKLERTKTGNLLASPWKFAKHDLHATILHLMGFNHERLTYRHAGRDYRLTDVHGRVVREIVA